MEAFKQSFFEYNDRAINIIRDISWAAGNRAAGVLWSISGFFSDFAPVAAVKLRACIYTIQAAFANVLASEFLTVRNVRVIAAGSLAALILVLVPTGATARIAVFNGDDALLSEAGIPELPEKLPSTGIFDVGLQEYGDLPVEAVPLGSWNNTSARSIAGDADVPAPDAVEEAAQLRQFAGIGNVEAALTRRLTGLYYADQRNSPEVDEQLRSRSENINYGDADDPADFGAAITVSDGPGDVQGQVSFDEGAESESVSGAITYSAETSEAAKDDIAAETADDGLETDPIAQSVGSYIWPAEGNLSSRFGYRRATVGSTYHKGIDITGRYGQSIYAAAGGEVIVSGWSNSYGYVIQILHENGHVTLYCHCRALLVSVGEQVVQGQEIAQMGRTGVADGVHLHFELLIDGVNVDPLPYLPPIG